MVAQSHAGMWKRNGEGGKERMSTSGCGAVRTKLDFQRTYSLILSSGYALLNQIYLYHNVRCRSEMFDRDVQVLQICASLLDPNEFLIQVNERQ